MPKILLVGGSRDGEWIDEPKLPRYHSILQELKAVYEENSKEFSPYRTEVYTRRVFRFSDKKDSPIYVLEGIDDYTAFELLMKYYNPKKK